MKWEAAEISRGENFVLSAFEDSQESYSTFKWKLIIVSQDRNWKKFEVGGADCNTILDLGLW